MAETESGPEIDIKAAKEALGAQQKLLQKLYAELDKEREASAVAVSEALSMILRLQEEKAAMKMEASQYQRMAEEKICHTEDSLASFEDIIYQKEMIIASLEYQVQAYRYKLLSLGGSDLGPCEFKFEDSFLLQKNDSAPKREIGANSSLRRIKSLPLTQPDELYFLKNGAESETFENLKLDRYTDSLENPDSSCLWEQIKMLDEQVKEISDFKGYAEDKSESLNGGIDVSPSHIQDNPDESRGVNPDVSPKCGSSSSVQDIFEIPEVNQNLKACQSRIQLQKKLIFEGESRLGKLDSVPIEPKLIFEGESRIGKLDSVPIEPFKLLPKSLEQAKAKKASSVKSLKNKSSKSRKGKAIGSGTTPARQQIDEIVAESQPFQQICRVIEQFERNRSSTRQEITSAGAEEMRLLKDIQDQLNSIQSEMKSLKIKHRPSLDNKMFDILQEVGYSLFPFLFH